MNLRASIQTFLDQTKAWAEAATISSYDQKLQRFALFAGDRELSTALLIEYKAALFRAELKESSIAGYFSTLGLFLNWCVQNGLLPSNPMPERMGFVIAQSDRQPITSDELNRLVATAEKIPGYEYWPLAINVGWHTGLRLSDVAMLRNVSLNVSGCAIRLIPKKTRRHLRIVEIPVPDDLMALLAVNSKGEYVFPDMAKLYRKDRHKTLSNQFGYVARKAGVPKSFHCFRNTRISLWLEMGVSEALVSNMTGINLNQILTYYKPSLDQKRVAMGLVKRKDAVA